MKSTILEDPLDKIVQLGRTNKPQRIEIHDQKFILLPNLSEELLRELEYFLEDRLDRNDDKLKKEINDARNQIANNNFMEHNDIWSGLS